MIVSDKKKIMSVLNDWPKIKKSFINKYNGDFDKVVFDFYHNAVFMTVK